MVKHAAGNPWTDADIDNRGVVDFMWNHAVISDKAAGLCKTSLGSLEQAHIFKFFLATLSRCPLCYRAQQSALAILSLKSVLESRSCCCADALLDNCNFSHIGPLLQEQAANGALTDTASAKVIWLPIPANTGTRSFSQTPCLPFYQCMFWKET